MYYIISGQVTVTTSQTIVAILTVLIQMMYLFFFAIRSGLLNFCAVALALADLGYKAVGIRIDSGDLAYLSQAARETFDKLAVKFAIPWFSELTIVASSDINENIIISLNEQVS